MTTAPDTANGTKPGLTAPPPEPVKIPRAALAAMAVIITASVMDHLDGTIMNVAGPILRHDLNASSSALQWIVAGYTLAFAVTLTTGGRLGDVFGRKRMFLTGVAGFMAGSILCSVSTSDGTLIASRILQGAFAAVMIPQGLGIMKQMVPPGKVTAVFGIFGPLIGVATTAGPILGGWLVNANVFGLGWRSIFLVNVPLAIGALFFAVRLLPADEKRKPEATARRDHDGVLSADGKQEPEAARRRDHDDTSSADERREPSAAPSPSPKLDLVGMVLATAAIMLLVYPLVQGREAGWPAWTFAMMASSPAVFAAFVLHQRLRSKSGRDPFVVPTLFRKRSFTSGLAVMTAFAAAMTGVVFSLTLFLQSGLGFTALHAGLSLLPLSVGTILSIGAGQLLLPRLGARRTLQLGMLVMAAGVVYLAVTTGRHGTHSTSWQIAGPLFVTGAGMGLAFGPIFGTVLGDLGPEEVGSASGLLTAVEQLAGALGVAALGTVFFDKAVPAHGSTDYVGAARLVFVTSAGLLVLAWALAFTMSKHVQEEV